jgi:hypothetical protein
MNTCIFKNQHQRSPTSTPTNPHNGQEKLTEGMKRLGNYIREETNNISAPYDIYASKNDVIMTNEDDDWTKQQRKGAAKTKEASEAILIIRSDNSFNVLAEDYMEVAETIVNGHVSVSRKETIVNGHVSAPQAETIVKVHVSVSKAEKYA